MRLSLTILTPADELFSGQVDNVKVPAVDGIYELLPEHAPIFIALQAGALTVSTSEKTESWFVEGGTCHMLNNQCVVTLKGIIDMTTLSTETLVTALKRNVDTNFSHETRQLLEAQLAYKSTL